MRVEVGSEQQFLTPFPGVVGGSRGQAGENSGRFDFEQPSSTFGTFCRKMTSTFEGFSRGGEGEPKVAQRDPTDAPRRPKEGQSHPKGRPKGAQGHPKGSQKEPKVGPKAAKGTPTI